MLVVVNTDLGHRPGGDRERAGGVRRRERGRQGEGGERKGAGERGGALFLFCTEYQNNSKVRTFSNGKDCLGLSTYF